MGQNENGLRRLLPRHYRVVDLCLEGLDGKAIADELGMSTVAVSYIVNSPVFQSELSRRRESKDKSHDHAVGVEVVKAKRVLEGAACAAANVHVGLLEAEDDAIAQRSASEILNRVGLGKVEKKDPGGNVTLISIGTMNILRDAMREDEEMDKAIDATPVAVLEDAPCN